MNIAFATIYDSTDITRGSGGPYYLTHELAKQGHTLHRIGPIEIRTPLISRVLRRAHQMANKRYVTMLDPLVGWNMAHQVEQKLIGVDYDVLLTNDMCIAAFTNAPRPLILYTDVMITRDYAERNLPHSRLSNLSPVSLWLSRYTIRQALRKAALSVFPVDWSATEARRYEPQATIEVIHYGANVDDPGAALAQSRQITPNRPIQMLFVGKDWLRKGGDTAVETVYDLRQRGIDAHLHIIGEGPDTPINSDAVTVHGLLSKANDQQRARYRELFLSADVFILPSSSEGMVLAPLEAAAYGMPSLGYRAMGVDTSIQHDLSGILLPLGAPAREFANMIAHWLECPDEYVRLAKGARKHYEQSVNWTLAATQLTSAISKVVGNH